MNLQRYLHQRSALLSIKLFPRKDYKKTVLLAGTGRSGTTWITNIINHQNDYRIIFEPFHAQYVTEFKDFNLRQYFPPDTSDRSSLQPLDQLLKGRIFTKWTDSRLYAFFPEKMLIKDIRANLLIKWIHQHYPAIKFVLLLRHPYSVFLSKQKLGWGAGMSVYLEQPDLVRDHLVPYLDTMKTVSTDLEKITTAWCIENLVPLRQFAKDELLVCHYENFIDNPKQEIARLMRYLDEPVKDIPEKILGKPSDTNWNLTDHSRNIHHAGPSRLSREEKADLHKVNEILAAFDLDYLYDSEGHPLPVEPGQ